MSNKEKIASFLEQSPGEVVSGASLARELGISRTAVWKNIQSLRDEGYPILAVPNKGYCLEASTDNLSEELIVKDLGSFSFSGKVHVHKVAGSTNELAKVLAKEGAAHGTIVVADEQVQGKGRRGKDFFSPKGKGIYMSMLLRPKVRPEEALHLTIQAAVAVCDVLEGLYPEEFRENIKIKWVNDVFIFDRKVAGILTEAAMEMESGLLDYVIVGIGINTWGSEADLPDSIRSIAGFLSQYVKELPSRNSLIAAIVNRFEEIVMKESFSQTVVRYAQKSYLDGKEIQFDTGSGVQKGTVLGVEEEGGLLVECEDGTKSVLRSGEVELVKGNGAQR